MKFLSHELHIRPSSLRRDASRKQAIYPLLLISHLHVGERVEKSMLPPCSDEHALRGLCMSMVFGGRRGLDQGLSEPVNCHLHRKLISMKHIEILSRRRHGTCL